MMQLLWLFIGLLSVVPLLLMAHRETNIGALNTLGIGLVVAALLYVVFALIWGDTAWVLVELLIGVTIYGAFFWLAKRFSALWLAAGWALHTLWDMALHLYGIGTHIVPEWYAWACVSFDLAVAAYIYWRFRQ